MRRIKSLLFLMVAGVMASCGSQSEEQAAQAEVVIPQVRVKQVFEREVEQIETFSATVAANVVNNISPKMSLPYVFIDKSLKYVPILYCGAPIITFP